MSNTNLRPFGGRDKLGYAMGDMGCNFAFQIVNSYMQLFYCQFIGIKAEHYAVIIIISKLWDAINDVLIGNMVDTKRISKNSKFKPWIIIGAVGLVGLTIMLFTPVNNFSYGGKIAWCLIAYCLWSVAYTLVNVPYGSMLSVITDKPDERTSLSTMRSIGAALPGIIVMLVLPKIAYTTTTNADGAETEVLSGNVLFIVSIVLSVLAFFTLWGTTKLVTERVNAKEGEATTGAKAFFSAFKSFFTNRAMIGVSLATVSSVAFFNSTMSLNNMVFEFFFKDTSKISLAMVGSYAPLVVAMALVGKLTRKFGKKKVAAFSMLISTVAGIASIIIPLSKNMTGMIIYIILLMFLNSGNGIFQITVWAMVGDCIEISYRKTKKNEEGSLYALYSFFRKLSQGIGQAVSALGLAAIGFKEGENAVQPATFGDDVLNLYFIILFAGAAIGFVAMAFIYNIDKKNEEALAAPENTSNNKKKKKK